MGGTVYHTGNSALGMKNLLINSNGLVNQRGYVSGTATTVPNQYTVDRWRVVTSGQNLTFTTTNGVTTFTAPAGGVEQVIENLNVLGGSYVLTIGGTATATVSESADNVTYTTLTPTNGIYTVTGGKYVKVTLSSGTFSLPQFERGTIATPYEFREFGGEVQACQRYLPYFDSTNAVSFLGGADMLSSTSAYAYLHFKTQPRATPTGMVLSSPSHVSYSGASAGVASAVSVVAYSLEGVSLSLTLPAQTVGGGAVFFNTASAYLYLTGCEL